jgi:hypothetical protein
MAAINGVSAVETAAPACAQPAQSGAGAAITAGSTPHSQALVPLEAYPNASIGLASRPSATFLAQLIASNQQAPQAREKRRAEPAEARSAYAAAAAHPPWIGGAIYRSL